MREGNRCERFEEKQSNGKNKWTGLKVSSGFKVVVWQNKNEQR